MLTHQQMIILFATFSLTNALHAPISKRDTTPAWSWAKDATDCNTDACLSDCQAATAKICAMSSLQTAHSQTVGDCTAYYWFDSGNTVPTTAQCNAAYGQITGPPSTAGSAQDCPGYVGGALGYDSSNKRTSDPVYMVYPKAGNGNCLKASGDTSAVLPLDAIPNSNGQTLPAICPANTASSKRRRSSTAVQARDDSTQCSMKGLGTDVGCSAACIDAVTTTDTS